MRLMLFLDVPLLSFKARHYTLCKCLSKHSFESGNVFFFTKARNILQACIAFSKFKDSVFEIFSILRGNNIFILK